MTTKVLMTSSAIALATAGILLTFLPEEVLSHFDFENAKPLQLLVQTLGALYCSLGMLNWMTKSSPIGGIYNRPIAVANFTHFAMAGLALVKGLISHPNLSHLIWTMASVYSVLAMLFGIVLFQHPFSERRQEGQ